MRLTHRLAAFGSLAALIGSVAGTQALATDFHVVLNYNWNGMVHPGEGTIADDPNGFRSISDRALSIDGGANSFGTNPLVGATAITYDIVRNAGEFDIVHLGNTGTGTVRGWDPNNTNANISNQPAWLANAGDHALPQTKSLTGLNLTLDSNSSIGFLYNVSNNGGNFQVVLTFTDATSATVTLAASDWFGPVNPPAAAAGVSSQTRIGVSWQGTSGDDIPVVQTWPTQALNVVEGVITVQSLINAGLGNHAGKQLASVTFQNPNPVGRGYAIMAMTVVTGLGPPANDNCAAPQNIPAGVTATNNIRATGASTSGCGTADTTDVWYRYTHTGAAGAVEARTCDSNLDTTIAVFTSCAGSALTCNDNACGLGSRARWTAQTGQAYLIRVAANAGATGQFNLTIDTAPETHTDTTLSLPYNWNGMVHNGESGNPDAPNGYRSLADRGLTADGVAGSVNAGFPVGDNFIPYSFVNQADVVDLVRLGNNRGFNAVAGDNVGTQPAWLPNPNQSGPFVANIANLNIFLGANTKFGFLYQITNGGGTFHAVLGFSDGTSADVTLAAADWYQDQSQNVPLPNAGVALQRQWGVFSATTNQDMATLNAPTLNVTEAIVSVQQMITDGVGDFTGKRLVSLTFSQPQAPAGQGIGIFAATVRDPGPVGALDPYGVGSSAPNPVVVGNNVVVSVAVALGGPPNNAISSVAVDGGLIGFASPILLHDDGLNGDATAGDSIWSASVHISDTQPSGPVTLPFTIRDVQNRTATGNLTVTAVAPPASHALGTLPQGLTTYTDDVGIAAGEVKWLKFTLATAVDATAGTYLDIDTETSAVADTEIGLYSAASTHIADDDDSGTGFWSQLTFGLTDPARPAPGNGLVYNGRNGAHLNPGVYYLAYGAFNTLFGGSAWDVTSTAGTTGSFTFNFTLGGGTSCPADVAGLGGSIGPDGLLTADDIIVFLDAFFNNNLAIADVAGLGGSIGPDGQLTADDIIVFLGSFFAGCGGT